MHCAGGMPKFFSSSRCSIFLTRLQCFLFHSQEGTHVIVASEVGAFVNGVGVGTSLHSGSFKVIFVKGRPSKLNVGGTPVRVYSSSIGANLQASEVSSFEFPLRCHSCWYAVMLSCISSRVLFGTQVVSYATDRLVPLDSFTVNAVDGGYNLHLSLPDYYYINTTSVLSTVTTSKTSTLLSSSSPPLNTSFHLPAELINSSSASNATTVDTYWNISMHTEVNSTHETTYNTTTVYTITRTIETERIITASLNDTSGEAYPYIISNNTVFNREAVLVAGQSDDYPRKGSLSVQLSSGTATFTGARPIRFISISLENYEVLLFTCSHETPVLQIAALHMRMPAVGTYQLKFRSSDIDLQPATVLINVVTVSQCAHSSREMNEICFYCIIIVCCFSKMLLCTSTGPLPTTRTTFTLPGGP